jgi:hypothetical protein
MIECQFLSPPTKAVPRSHCVSPYGEGDCHIHLGGTTTCRIKDMQVTPQTTEAQQGWYHKLLNILR